MSDVTCATFADAVDDLALGFASSPERDDLVAHASRCADCATLLHDLTAVADALLELAPEAEPPLGFEARVIGRLPRVAATSPPRSPRRPGRAVLVGAAAAVAAIVGVGGLLSSRTDEPGTLAASIEGRRGDLGRVELVRDPSPKVVVLLEDDSWSGVWVCELEDGGRWVEVGRWRAEDAAGGAWAATIDRSLLDATRMRITSTSGSVIATSGPLE